MTCGSAAGSDEAFLGDGGDEGAGPGVEGAVDEASRAVGGGALGGVEEPVVEAVGLVEPEGVVEAGGLVAVSR